MRPNAIPAKDFYKNDARQTVIESSTRRLDGRTRRLIGDLCDFCLELVYVNRDQLRLRLRGFKFGCHACHAKGCFKWKVEGGTEKVLPTHKTNVRDSVKKPV